MTTNEVVTGRQHGSYLVNPQLEHSTAGVGGLGARLQDKLDGIRNWTADHCCGFARDVPSIVFLITLCLLLALLLALIPLLILILSSSETEAQRRVDMKLIRSGHLWPGEDVPYFSIPRGEAEDELAGLPAHVFFPPNVSSCIGHGFTCTDEPDKVISSSLRCNGHADCPDESDELNCQTCQSPFSCPFNNSTRNVICFSAAYLCDRVLHCPDGSDERDFCRNECEHGEYKCGGEQKLCLPLKARCDGVRDCTDGSDEQDCDVCSLGAKKCEDRCVPASKLCDGKIDCADGTDEKECDCRSCSGSSVALCGDGTCISREKVCDGRVDCADGMDEDTCPGYCKVDRTLNEMVHCSNGRLYPQAEACRGEVSECAYNCTQCDERAAHTCSDDGKCIAQSMICDGNPDCVNEEDEQNCDKDCNQPTAFQCSKSKKCISAEQRCDGVWHCEDHSDEKQCVECSNGGILCGSNCVPKSSRCDGIADCKDGTDEMNCSCDECLGTHSNTYMCHSSGRCLLRSEVCTPYSNCPNASHIDKLYCARFALPSFHI